MSGQEYQTQLEMKVPPTEGEHVVRLMDMVRYIAGKIKDPALVVSTENLVGAYDDEALTFTLTDHGVVVIDGVTLEEGDRVLFTGQTDKTQNGIYELTVLGADSVSAVFTRTEDANTSAKMFPNMNVNIITGSTYHDSNWVLTTDPPIILDTTELTYERGMALVSPIREIQFDIIGDDITMEWEFVHGWNTINVTHEIFDAVTKETVVFDFKRIDENTVRVLSGQPLGEGRDFKLVLRAKTL